MALGLAHGGEMLVLSRRVEEALIFPELGVLVVVTGIDQGKVRLGIVAPEKVRVFREEVWNRMDPWEVQAKPGTLPGGAAPEQEESGNEC
jgi:carbon storage regulator CsrA